MSRTYPEWFIDGPWHGEDKRKKAPHLQTAICVALPRPISGRELLAEANELDLNFDRYIYVPKHVNIFGEVLTVWISEANAGDFGTIGRESEWVRMLGQLIMAPHRTDQSTDAQSVAWTHRQRWDVENEVRREIRHEIAGLRRENEELRRTLQRAQTQVVLEMQSAYKALPDKGGPAAMLELTIDGVSESILFQNVVLYFDDGDGTAENPPSWIATAQDKTSRPCTGYGTTEKAAIIALLADGLGVYARMIEIGDRMK